MLGRFTFIVLAALLAGTAVNAPAAPSLVTGVSLTHEGQYTVVGIQGDGPMRVSHQSVIAKEGKPFRIVVDCLASRHGLAQKEYAALPSCIVTALRTSQYAVNPEEIVRVVIDLARESVYRVETSGQTARIYVSDPQTNAFAAWASAPATKTQTVPTPAATVKTPSIVAQPNATPPAQQKATPSVEYAAKAAQTPSNQPTDNTKNAQANQKPAEVIVAKTPTSAVQTPSNQPANNAKNAQANQKPAEVIVAKAPTSAAPTPSNQPANNTQNAQTKQSIEAVAEKNAVPETATGKALPPAVAADLAKKSNEMAWLFGNADDDNAAVPTPGDAPGATQDVHKAAIATPVKPAPAAAEPQSSAAPKPAAPETNDAGRALASVEPADVPAPPPAEDEEALDDVAAADLLPAVDQPSKYRRDAARNVILKQTQVVEFPKRMVTTYESPEDRDPFETLVDQTRPTKGGIENRLANVETLLLVGLLESETGKTAALLEDLDGIGYILKPGDPVKNGYVSEINDDAVLFQINEYGWSRTVVKELDNENSHKQ